MNKAIQLPYNAMKAFTFASPSKVNLFTPLITVIMSIEPSIFTLST